MLRSVTTAAAAADGLVGWLRGLTRVLLLGVGMVLLFRRAALGAADALESRPLASAGVGLAGIVLVPIAALSLVGVGLLVGGWWLGALLAAPLPLALAVGYGVAGLTVGRWLIVRWGRGTGHPLWAVVVGIVLLALAAAVPVVGPLTTLGRC
jgi:hypothetical protein